MIKPVAFLLFPAMLAPAVVSAKDSAPIMLEKTAGWEINYDDDSCHLAAAFGKDDQRIIARLTKFQPSERFQLILYGKPIRGLDSQTEITLDFGLDSKPRTVTGLLGSNGKLPLIIVSGTSFRPFGGNPGEPTMTTPQQEASISGLTFKLRGAKPYRLAFKTMGPPMAAMRTCLADLERHWGYDPSVLAKLLQSPTPIGSPGNWVTDSDYPSAAVANGHNGLTHFRLDVDETGKVLKCVVIAKTTPDDFEKATCQAIVRRARLEPALDASGQPVKAYYINSVRWTMGI